MTRREEALDRALRNLIDEANRVIWAEEDEGRQLPHLSLRVAQAHVALALTAPPPEGDRGCDEGGDVSNRVRMGVRWWTRLRCWLFGHGNADPRVMASFDGRKTWEHLCERCGGRKP